MVSLDIPVDKLTCTISRQRLGLSNCKHRKRTKREEAKDEEEDRSSWRIMLWSLKTCWPMSRFTIQLLRGAEETLVVYCDPGHSELPADAIRNGKDEPELARRAIQLSQLSARRRIPARNSDSTDSAVSFTVPVLAAPFQASAKTRAALRARRPCSQASDKRGLSSNIDGTYNVTHISADAYVHTSIHLAIHPAIHPSIHTCSRYLATS